MEYNRIKTYETTIDESNENDILFIQQCRKYDESIKINFSAESESVNQILIVNKLNTIDTQI